MDAGMLSTATTLVRDFFLARSLVTGLERIRIFSARTPAEEVAAYLAAQGYDLAIVEAADGGKARGAGPASDAGPAATGRPEPGYALLEDLQAAASAPARSVRAGATPAGACRRPIAPEERVPLEASTVEVLQRFGERRYLFAFTREDRFAGLITYADLNRAPVYALCYVAISELERLLRRAAELRFQGEEWLGRLSDASQREIGAVYVAAKAKGVETSLLECTTITHLKEILQAEGPLMRELGYASKEEFKRSMTTVIRFRNMVMHARTLVTSRQGGEELFHFVDDLSRRIRAIGTWLGSDPINHPQGG